MIVNCSEFLNRLRMPIYRYGAYIPLSIYNKICNKDSAFTILPDSIFVIIEDNIATSYQRDSVFAEISFHWRTGLEYEIQNRHKEAAHEYNEGILLANQSSFDMSHIEKICKHRLKIIMSKLSFDCHE